MEKELRVQIDPRHKYSGVDLDTSLDKIECTCKGENVKSCKEILPCAANTPIVLVYNSCKRTLFAALKRQLRKTATPSGPDVYDLQLFMTDYFKKYVEPVLENFDYSYTEWYNKLTLVKQEAIDRRDDNALCQNVYGLFCKREKQEDGGKNRAISNISNETKFVMGPVIWALEQFAADNFPGYCGGLNWKQLENYYDDAFSGGYQFVVQGDGSAFDLSQSHDCKFIDRLIYNWLVDNNKIHHVDPEIFRKVSTQRIRTMKATYNQNGRMYVLGKAQIDGTVFSGSSDTTFGNTLRMAIYNMFTLHKAGLKYKEDYVLKAKGDDFFILSRKQIDWDSAYYRYWLKPPSDPMTHNYEPYGIGQVLKFLVVGDYSTLDFCSTTVCPYNNGTQFKILRKPDRIDPLTHYSRQALHMTNPELKAYYLDLALSFESYASGLPLYQDYADALRYHASKIVGKPKRIKPGKPPKVLPHDGHMLTHAGDLDFRNFSGYNYDFIEALKTRTSNTRPTRSEVLTHLMYRYKITQYDLENHRLFLFNGGLYDHLAGALG